MPFIHNPQGALQIGKTSIKRANNTLPLMGGKPATTATDHHLAAHGTLFCLATRHMGLTDLATTDPAPLLSGLLQLPLRTKGNSFSIDNHVFSSKRKKRKDSNLHICTNVV